MQNVEFTFMEKKNLKKISFAFFKKEFLIYKMTFVNTREGYFSRL